jgi:hypothetical protein
LPDPLWIDADAGAPAYSAAELRQAMALALAWDGRAMGARQGVRPGGTQLQVSLVSTTITVAPGLCCIDPGLSTPQGPYWVAIPTAEQHTLTAADATNPRKDIVIVRVYDDVEDSSGLRLAQTEYLVGTPAGSPAEPAVPAGAMRLATIDVPASGGGSAVVTDRRPFTVAAGGVLPIASSTERDALNPWSGQQIWRTDTGRAEAYHGGSWRTMPPYFPVGCQYRRATQSVPTATPTLISWDQEDEDSHGFATTPSTTITIPAGWAGVYGFTYYCLFNSLSGGRVFGSINVTSSVGAPPFFRAPTDSSEDRLVIGVPGIRLAAGDTVTCDAFHSHGSNINITAFLSVYRWPHS